MMASFDMLRSQQDAARALFELAGRSTTLPAAPAPLPGMGAPLFLLPSLHQSQSGGAFFPNLFVPGGLCLPTLPAFTSTPSSGAPTPSSATGNNQRLSVAYLLNNDDSLTTGRPATIKQEPATAAPVLHKRKTSSSTSTSSSATRGSKRPKVEPSFSSSPASSSPPSSPPSHSSSLSSTSSIASSSTSTPFKGDLSLFPHLQLQLQREQLDPQQHTELVLKVWNRQQQVLKLQQLQQKKQELKAQRLRQRQSRKGSKGAVASPLSPGSSSSSPSSPASADVAAQSALPTIDDILNGADVQVDESSGGSDEDGNGNKKGSGKRPRRRITARQVAVLEQVFAVEPFPGPSTKKVIAKKLGMQERSITIWFQNKRARLKRIDGDSATGHHHGQVGENGKREVTFHNLAVGFDGKLDMLPEDF